MAAYEERRAAFAEQGVTIMAGSVDDLASTNDVAADLGFSVAHGVTRAQADELGAWWDESRGFMQPSEFLMSANGKVIASTYSNSPIGRMDAAETLTMVTYMNGMRAKAQKDS